MGALVTLLIYASACPGAPAGKAAHVTLNEDGVLLIDGRKILPIGFTGGPPPDGRTPEGKPAFEEICEAGGTFFRTGLQEGDRDNELLLRSILNRFRNHPGLLLWKNVDEPWWGKLPVKVEDAHDVEFCVREVGNDLYLLACKREGQTLQVKFTGLPTQSSSPAHSPASTRTTHLSPVISYFSC
jgi:hypothetical protein